MTSTDQPIISPEDRRVLRDLARRVAEIGRGEEMAQRRRLWKRHTAMDRSVRPVVYIDPQGSWDELIPPGLLRCPEGWGRTVERELRQRIYTAEHFVSDNVIEAEWIVPKAIRSTGWGLTPRRKPSTDQRGAFAFDPVVTDAGDLKKLRYPEVAHDEAATGREYERAADLLGDILDVRVKGTWQSIHLMNQWTALRGYDQVLTDMYESPALLHEAMAFLAEGHHRLRRQYVEQGLFGLNNDNSPIYTSGHGYTDELPRAGADPARPAPADLWAWAEAQEMAVVSPEQHEEFVFQYERPLLAPYGLTGYGCCEDLTRKLHFVLTIPHLRRVSICPWADVDACAAQLGPAGVIFMWKPQPAHLVGSFDDDRIRAYIRHGVAAAKQHGCVLELALLDTHTCEARPERFDRWSRIVREEVELR